MATLRWIAELVTVLPLLWMLDGSHAHAEDAPRVTDQGHIMIGGGLGGSWSNDQSRSPWPHFQQWSAHANPSLSYFLRDHVGLGVSLGGALGRDRFETLGYELRLREHQAFVGVHALFEWLFSERFGVWAIPQVAFVRVWRNWSLSEPNPVQAQGRNLQGQTIVALIGDDFDARVLRLSVVLPFVFHASPVVVLGFGPELTYDQLLSRDPDTDWSAFERDLSGLYLGASSWIGVAF